MVALIVPFVGMLRDRPLPSHGAEQTLGQALREACSHSGFWLLALGFFVCGFQVVFIGVHLPATWLTSTWPRPPVLRCWRWSACSISWVRSRLAGWVVACPSRAC